MRLVIDIELIIVDYYFTTLTHNASNIFFNVCFPSMYELIHVVSRGRC